MSIKKLSLIGSILTGASIITAAVLPQKRSPKNQLAKLQGSAGYNGVQRLTCTLTEASVADNCHYTETLPGNAGFDGTGSRTTTSGTAASSSITTKFGDKVKTISDITGRNSSKSPS